MTMAANFCIPCCAHNMLCFALLCLIAICHINALPSWRALTPGVCLCWLLHLLRHVVQHLGGCGSEDEGCPIHQRSCETGGSHHFVFLWRRRRGNSLCLPSPWPDAFCAW